MSRKRKPKRHWAEVRFRHFAVDAAVDNVRREMPPYETFRRRTWTAALGGTQPSPIRNSDDSDAPKTVLVDATIRKAQVYLADHQGI